MDHLICHVGCRTLFATHYHSLVEDWAVDPRVKLGHMDCLVDDATASSESTNIDEKVTFLYHLCDGSSPKSYGVNVARLAGLPPKVLALAVEQSNGFLMKSKVKGSNECESFVTMRRYFDLLLSIANSNMNPVELAAVAMELWKRYNHECSTIMELS